MTKKNIRIHMSINCTEVLGPFNRYVLWTQGCKKNCAGCMSQNSRALDGGTLIPINKIYNEIITQQNIEGITISGGEPLLQAEVLCDLVTKVRAKKDLGVIVYSGYTLEEINEWQGEDANYIKKFLSVCDLLIDGSYIELLNDGKSLRGSSNQRVHLLTDRYASIVDEFYGVSGRKVEMRIYKENVILLGIPSKDVNLMWQDKKTKV